MEILAVLEKLKARIRFEADFEAHKNELANVLVTHWVGYCGGLNKAVEVVEAMIKEMEHDN